MTRFICISGKAQSGKDTSAGFLKKELEMRGYKVLIAHYADLLKYICKTYFGWNGEKDVAGRQLLQRVGTDVVRKQCPDFWVDFVTKVVEMFPNEWDYVIVPDTRFPNEIYKVRYAGFDVCNLRIERLDYDDHLTEEQKKHASETALDGYQPDMTLLNYSRGLDGLQRMVEVAVEKIVKWDFERPLERKAQE